MRGTMERSLNLIVDSPCTTTYLTLHETKYMWNWNTETKLLLPVVDKVSLGETYSKTKLDGIK